MISHLISNSRELFIDSNRAISTTKGEKDNKRALELRKKELAKEESKYGITIDEEIDCKWTVYFSKVYFLIRQSNLIMNFV